MIKTVLRSLVMIAVLFTAAIVSSAQTSDCPAGFVCLPQVEANDVFKQLTAFVAAKDVIAQLKAKGVLDEATIASALRVIEDYKAMEKINSQIIVKLEKVVELYEKVIGLYQTVVEKLTAQLNAPKSAWKQFLGAVKAVVTFVGAFAIGRLIKI